MIGQLLLKKNFLMNSEKFICILDYGSGNVQSVYNLISFLGHRVIISNEKAEIEHSTHLILPGVGSFGAAITSIKEKIPLDILEYEVFQKRKPFLGICVGMQVLATFGNEYGIHDGLGWVNGKVDKVDSLEFPLPHIGWNNLNLLSESPIFNGLNGNLDFYFVHSFALVTDEKSIITSNVEYGTTFCSSIQKENIFGVQFHPEKSQKAGEILLQNFIDYK
jgi:glutamine amidotransferase